MALTLTRRVGERIFVDDRVVISVTEITGNRVRLSFDAPEDVIVLREEVKDAMERQFTGCGSTTESQVLRGLYR